jgi:hypothetical protein
MIHDTPTQIQIQNGDDNSHANINIPSVKSIPNLDLLSMQPIIHLDSQHRKSQTQTKSAEIIVGGDAPDDVSAPTVEGSFTSDEDFSLISEKDFVSTLELKFPTYSGEENDDLSLSSINTKALLQITELRKKLRIQENTKLELLNQCLRLESRLEKNDCKHAYLKIYRAENNQLREATAKMERDFMNEMNEIVTKMTIMEKEYMETLKSRDEKIERLEQELSLLKVAKNLDLDVTTHVEP